MKTHGRFHGTGTEQAPSANARRAARAAYPDSKGFQAAHRKGWYARLAGRTLDQNPYRGALHGKRRNYVGKRSRGAVQANGTFTFAWRNAWELGWRAADKTTTGGGR